MSDPKFGHTPYHAHKNLNQYNPNPSYIQQFKLLFFEFPATSTFTDTGASQETAGKSGES
jgi:hypothetical protein